MSKLAFGLIGLALGWLAASQFPLWPTPAAGLFQPWTGAWRVHADGKLHRDSAILECPNTIKAFVLQSAIYVGLDGVTCEYRHPDNLFDLSIELEAPTFKQAEGRPAEVRLARGNVQGRRVTDLEDANAEVLKQDILIVSGSEGELIVRCSSWTPLDVEACHAVQAAFYAAVDPLSLGPEQPD